MEGLFSTGVISFFMHGYSLYARVPPRLKTSVLASTLLIDGRTFGGLA